MKPSEIITSFSKKNGLDSKIILRLCAYFIKNKQGFMLSKNNTVVMFIEIAPKTYECHIATEDSPLGIMKAMSDIFRRLHKLNVKKIYGHANNFEIVAIMRKIVAREGGTLETADIKEYNWKITL